MREALHILLVESNDAAAKIMQSKSIPLMEKTEMSILLRLDYRLAVTEGQKYVVKIFL